MRKIFHKITFMLVGIMAHLPVYAEGRFGLNEDAIKSLCDIGAEFHTVFKMLQLLAFIGAGVTIAGWAWGYISTGSVNVVKEVKDKGVGMLIGFVLLFGVGILLNVFISMVGPKGGLCDMSKFF